MIRKISIIGIALALFGVGAPAVLAAVTFQLPSTKGLAAYWTFIIFTDPS